MAEAPPPKGSSGSVGVEDELIVSLISLVYQQLSIHPTNDQRFLKCFFTYVLVISQQGQPVLPENRLLQSLLKAGHFIPHSLPPLPPLNQALRVHLDGLFWVLPKGFQDSTNLSRARPRVISGDPEKIICFPNRIQAGTTCRPRGQLPQ